MEWFCCLIYRHNKRSNSKLNNLLNFSMETFLIFVWFASSGLAYLYYFSKVAELNEELKKTTISQSSWLSEFKYLNLLLLVNNQSFVFRLLKENIESIKQENLRNLAKQCKSSYCLAFGLFVLSFLLLALKFYFEK